MDRDHIRDMRRRMRRHGFVLQGVLGDEPFEEPYAYTAGFQRLDPPAPEIITFGLPFGCAHHLAHTVFQRARAKRATLEPGAVLRRLEHFDRRLQLRVNAVQPQWAAAYAPVTGALLDRDTHTVPFVQLVWSDEDGRWPEQASRDECVRHHQPLLAGELAWPDAVEHTSGRELLPHQATGADRVALPVFDHVIPKGRLEVLAATRIGGDRARIEQVPWLADHTAYGDVVALREPTDAEAAAIADGARLPVAGPVAEDGGYQPLAYRLQPSSEDAAARLLTAVGSLTADPARARASANVDSLHLNTRDPQLATVALRPFLRDGDLGELALRSAPPDATSHPDGCTNEACVYHKPQQ